MSGAIHGQSHRALKVFRRAPAALAVYWDYVARTNRDNVAWPSLRALHTSTDWSVEACGKGRKLLVELEALEEVKDYQRPSWRGLTADELRQRQNLDQSEYFRPTGTILVAGVREPLLYFGGDDGDMPDVLPGRTTTPPMIGGAGQNVIPGKTQRDSKKKKESGDDGASPANPTPWQLQCEATRKSLHLGEIPFALIGKYAAFLGGTTPEKTSKGKSNGEWFDFRASPGLATLEIAAFGLWLEDVYDYETLSPLSTAEAIARWVGQFRGDEDNLLYMERARTDAGIVQLESASDQPAIATEDHSAEVQAALRQLTEKKRV